MTALQNRPAAVDVGEEAPSVSGMRLFRDVVASEWMKLRTIRSTYGFVLGAVVVAVFGMLALFFLIQSFDQATPAEQANYEVAEPTVVVMPFVMFFISCIGGMLITSEFTSGSIGPGLLAVPQRWILLAGKGAVAASVGLVSGFLFSLLATIGAMAMLGDRPAPLNPWPAWTDAIPIVLTAGVVVLVASLVALGFGALLRSTAGALLTMGGLIMVAPVFAHFLPTTWQLRVGSVLLPNLIPQLAGVGNPYLLSQVGAAAVLALYLLLALGAGAVTFRRRDAA
ncbi:ABC transporter permease [Micromonospora echinospora]|uniref:ABC transporter permease n=1 Tax=Micromonospora echinospora TaxID=1877 RepID=UPI003CEF78DF